MDIAGSISIFNISKGQSPVPEPKRHIREAPQLAQDGIFHFLHEQPIFVMVRNFTPTQFSTPCPSNMVAIG